MAVAPSSPEIDSNRATELIVVTWVACSLSLIVVALRLYSRARVTRNLWWDDLVMVFTMALTMTFSVFFTLYATKGGARHVVFLSATQVQETTLINWVSQTFCIMAIATGKISVAILMGRLMAPSKWRRWTLSFLAVSSFLAGSIIIIFIFAQCSPPKALWIPSAGKCWDMKKTNNLDVALASWYAFVDFALAIFGITMIWNLQINKKKKSGLGALLSLGFFASICAAVKTSYLPTLTVHSDFTWITVNLLIWNVLEVNIIVIAGCIPTLRPIFLIVIDCFRARVSKTRKSHSKLSSLQGRPSHELQPISIKKVHSSNDASHELPYGWPSESGAQIDTIPSNRILQIREFNTSFEDGDKQGTGKDEECGWGGDRAAISTRTIL